MTYLTRLRERYPERGELEIKAMSLGLSGFVTPHYRDYYLDRNAKDVIVRALRQHRSRLELGLLNLSDDSKKKPEFLTTPYVYSKQSFLGHREWLLRVPT